MAPRLVCFVVLFAIGVLPGERRGAAGSELFPGAASEGGPQGGSQAGPAVLGDGPGGGLFAEEPQDVVVRKGSDAVLACAAAPEFASWTVSWIKDDLPLPPADLPGGNLLIRQVSRSRPRDVGEYRCALQGPVGKVVSRAASLQVASLSQVIQGPLNVTVPVGGTARFTCSFDSVPTARITWKKDDKPLPVISRFVTLPSGVLLISKVESSDEGLYKCVATNDVLRKSRASNDANLRIGVPSNWTPHSFLSPSRPIQIVKGENVSVECSVSGGIVPVWSVSGQENINQSVTNLTMPGLSIISLINAHEDHSGTYNCTFSAASETFFQAIEIIVLAPPSVLKPPQSQTYPTARTARFNCEVSGVPFPNITWFRNGSKIETNGRVKVKDKELLISNSIASDTGLYQCMAQNSVGESWGVGYFYVNSSGLQDPPSNFACHKQGENFVVVQWNAPSEKITAYTVHYWPTGDRREYQQQLAEKNYCNVTGLDPFTNYTFSVRSYTLRGASEPSQEVTCETKESVPDVAPQVTLTIISGTKLQVSWVPPDPRQTFGRLTEYKVQWRQATRSTAKVKEVPAKVLNYTITDLTPGNKYEIRVLARTSRGWPKPSVEEILEWMPIEMPTQTSLDVPSAPQIHLTAVNSTCVEVKWQDVGSHSLKGWKVIMKKQGITYGEPTVVPINITKVILSDLEPLTFYEVQVLGIGPKGFGEVSSQKIRTPAGLTPSDSSYPEVTLEAPYGLEAEPTSPHSINLTWSAPPSSLDVGHYSVIIKVVHTSPSPSFAKTVLFNRTNLWVEIKDLQPNTIYELKLKLHDKNGLSSPFSEKIECRTFEDVPALVMDVRWESLNSTTIKVMWKEPSSPVSQFNVTLYSSDKSETMVLLVDGSHTSIEVPGIKPFTAYSLMVSGITRGGIGPASSLQTIFISAPEVVESPSGEQYASQTPDVPLILGVVISIAGAIVLGVMLVFMNTCKAARNSGPVGAAPGQSSYQSNGNGVHGQFPLTSFVSPDSNHYQQHYSTSRVDLEVREMNEKSTEECSVTLLPPGTTPTPIGANITQNVELRFPESVDEPKALPFWNGGVLPRHLFHITENPQYDCGKSEPLRYGHDRLEPESPEEIVRLLSRKASLQETGEEEDLLSSTLNVTEVTNIDGSFQDTSNNNNEILDRKDCVNSCHSSLVGSESSSSFLGDCSDESNCLTEQQLLVTLSSVPLNHLSTKPLISVSKVSVIGPNG